MAFWGRLRKSAGISLLAGMAAAQTPSPPPVPSPAQTPAPNPAPDAPDPVLPKGQILIQSHGDPPSTEASAPAPPAQAATTPSPEENAKADVSDAERSALTFISYDLDARLDLQRSALDMRARLTLRNDGPTPLGKIPLQVSSTLQWQSATLIDASGRTPIPLAQHRLDTDADHTGAATEAVLSLPQALAPGATVSLDVFYAGTITQDAGRLARLGASTSQQQNADWDSIGPSWTGLRGFGDVLWYPVSAPQLFLAEGNTLFTGIGRQRLREEQASIRLRLSITYTGEPPVAAYFCGRRATLKALADDPDAPTATGAGLASADFPAEPLGFRLPSLFVIEQPETMLSNTPTSSPEGPAFSSSSSGAPGLYTRPVPRPPATESALVALASSDPGSAAGLGAAADHVAALLVDWLGPQPLSALTVLDHSGQPFQDGPLLVAPASTLETSPEAPALVYSLTHAWVQTGQPWMDEGLAQFFTLLWTERQEGREVALRQMNDLLQPVAMVEPDLTSAADTAPGQPIIAAPDELFYRRKAAAVWWMLRDLAGEKPLRAALTAWRTQPLSTDSAQAQAVAFQHVLEHLSGKDLGWFFADWVLRDRGLPDLSIEDVQTTQSPASPGHRTGFLVAVTVRNEGAAAAEVPVIVSSGQFSSTERLLIPGFSQATKRVLVETSPTEVTVNDGSTPEVRTSTHVRALNLHPQ